MKFNYAPIIKSAPCFVLIKNMRYQNDDDSQKIVKGEIISVSKDFGPLMDKINTPKLNFASLSQLKRFLYMQGFFNDLEPLQGNDLMEGINKKLLNEIDDELNENLTCEEIINILLKKEMLNTDNIELDIFGTAYKKHNKIKDYQMFNETYDIRFFGGFDNTKFLEFVLEYFKKNKNQGDFETLLKVIKFGFFDLMDSYDGEKQIDPNKLWDEALNLLFINF